MSLRLAVRELVDALFPQRCVVCERFGAALHEACVAALAAADPPRCLRCWAPSLDSPCAGCRAAPPAFDALRTPYRFEGGVRRALLEAKFRGVTDLLPALAAAAASAVPGEWGVTMVVPVPLHRGRERQRGYNQAAILAEHVAGDLRARTIEARYEPGVLRRVRATTPQASLDAETRAQNLTFAFKSDPVAPGTSVLVVDDVTTTGSTLAACASALRAAGALRVFALAVARED